MDKSFETETTATAMAAFGLAQLILLHLLQIVPAEKEKILGGIRHLVESNRGAGSPENKLAAHKLEMLLGLYEKSQKTQQ
jgi:hypothetical protein